MLFELIIAIFKKEIPTEFIPFVGNITKIDLCAFQSSIVNNVVFTENTKLTVINSNAFSYSQLECFYCPATVITIEEYAFSNCIRLSYVEFPINSELKNIGDFAFSCSDINNMIIPSKVAHIGNNAFDSCNNMFFVNFLSDS